MCNRALFLLCAVCLMFVVVSAAVDDSHLAALSKCTDTAITADVKRKATDMCDGQSQTYTDFIKCATAALQETESKSVAVKEQSKDVAEASKQVKDNQSKNVAEASKQVKDNQSKNVAEASKQVKDNQSKNVAEAAKQVKEKQSLDVADAAMEIRNRFCTPFPVMNKFPATFYSTVQASLIIRHENQKRKTAVDHPESLDFVYDDAKKEHVKWEGAIGDHIRKGISTEVYSHQVGAEFWKQAYGLSTPNAAQWTDIQAAAQDCLKLAQPAGIDERIEKTVCDKAVTYRTGIPNPERLTGRSKLAGFEACVRAGYYKAQLPKAVGNQELLVMAPSWKHPTPKGGMLILQKNDQAPANTVKNPGNGELILVEAEYHPVPPDGLEEVLSFIVGLGCGFATTRMPNTKTKKEMCKHLDDMMLGDATFSHTDILARKEKKCQLLLESARTVAVEMLEKSPWITWTGSN